MATSKDSLLILLAFLSVATSCVAEEKVSVDLYYESLCPYSAKFIVNYLGKFFTDGLIDIVDLRMIPYGNARIGPNETITCQHGPYECTLNTIEACAIDLWPSPNEHFPFIYCIESDVLARKATQWETCFEKTSLDLKLIAECYESEHGKMDYENVEEYVCKTYKGNLPWACENLLKVQSSVNKERKGDGSQLCLKEAQMLGSVIDDFLVCLYISDYSHRIKIWIFL